MFKASKAKVKQRQVEACERYLAEHPVALTPREAAEHSGLMGDADVLSHRSVVLLQTRLGRTAEFCRAHIPLDATVADVGAATGTYLEAIGREGVAVNLDAAPVAAMRASGFDAQEGSIYDLPFGDGDVDFCLAFEVLEHLTDPIGAFRELRRVASRGLVVSVPHTLDTRVRRFGYFAPDAPREWQEREAHHHHVFEFTREQWASVASHGGWDLVASEPLIPFEPMPKWWLLLFSPA